MASLSLAEFADRVNEIMPVISREFLRHQSGDFYKMKITLPQFVVLDTLNRCGESRMSDLARCMSVTTAAITGIADRLVRDGYVVRASDPKDRRIVKVRLTAKGTSMIRKSIVQRKNMMMDIYGAISQKEREEYLRILAHIRDHIVEKNH